VALKNKEKGDEPCNFFLNSRTLRNGDDMLDLM